MKRKMTSLLMALCILMSLLPGTAFAADGSEFVIDEDGVLTEYNGDGGDVAIPAGVTAIGTRVFQGNTALTSVVIPSTVTSIGNQAFHNCTNLTSVVIPNTVTSIERQAFQGCANLTGVTIPEGVTSIGESAFNGCISMTSVVIPEGVTTIGTMAFYSCSALTSVTIPSSVTDLGWGVFFSCGKVTDVYYGGDKTAWDSIKGDLNLSGASISVHYTGEVPGPGPDPEPEPEPEPDPEPPEPSDDFVIENGVLVEYKGEGGDVVIPRGVTSIADKAFYQMFSLKSVTIPEGVTSVGNQAFLSCSAQTVTLPASLTSIGIQAFDYCRSLTDVYYGGTKEQWIALTVTVSEYGNGLNSATVHFTDGSTLEPTEYVVDENGVLLKYAGKGGNLMIPDYVTAIGPKAFYRKPLTGVIIPGSVKSIGDEAFYNCYNLAGVTMDPGVTAIGEKAFYLCGKLAIVELPDTVTGIGERAFSNCTALTSVRVITDEPEEGGIALPGADAQGIGEYAFSSCAGLRSVEIPSGITKIGSGAFSGCPALESIVIPDSVTSIEGQAFNACGSLIDVNYTGSKEAWAQIAIKQSGNSPLLTQATITYNYDPSGGPEGPGPDVGEQVGEKFTIKDGVLVKYNGTDANVVIPAGVTAIGASAFEKNMTLKSVTIPAGVKTIGNRAFMNCVELQSVSLPDGLVTIGDCAFDNCHSMPAVTIPGTVTAIGENAFASCSALKSVTIPGGVKHISSNAFNKCTGLTSVTIQNGVTGIGSSAFHSCSALTSISIPASVTAIEALAFKDCTSLASVTVAGNPTLGIPNAPDGYYLGNDIFKNTPWLKNQGDFATLNGRLVAYQGKGGDVTIPDSVTAIENLAFANNANLTSVTIPGSVKVIRNSAFSKCTGLTTVVLQEGVTTIEGYAFEYCTSLSSLTIPASMTSVGVNILHGCKGTVDIYYAGTEAQLQKWNLWIELLDGSLKTVLHASTPGTTPGTTPGSTPGSAADSASASASVWAREQVSQAISAGLVPSALQSRYTQSITRQEFCALANAVYQKVKGDVTPTASFSDTSDPIVLKMATVGVVNGVGNNRFDPSGKLTREQAATMLYRLAAAAGKPLHDAAATFADTGSVSSWASKAVGAVQAAGIMNGVGNSRFDPKGSYTIEQSILTMLRMYRYLNQ